jgi:hypothetical protein
MEWNLVTVDAMASLNIEALLASATERESFAYGNVLESLCAEGERWTPSDLACLRLLQGVLQMVLRHANPQEPFGPMFVLEGKRSCVPGDIPKDLLSRLHPWAETLADPELRARVLDVIWMQGRVFKAAQDAVQAYIEAAKARLQGREWHEVEARFERALRLAASLSGGGIALRNYVLGEMQSAVYQSPDDGTPLRRRLISLLLEFEHGDPAALGRLASIIGSGESTRGNYFAASEARSLAAACHLKAGDEAARAMEMAAAAEAIASEAEAALLRPGQGAMAASSIMGDAVIAMRRVAGFSQRAAELHARMLEWQPLALAQMKQISAPMNVVDLTRKAVEAVRGKSLRDAVRTFCGQVGTPTLDSLRQQVRREAQIAILGSLAPLKVVNYRGRVVATIPPLTPGIQDVADEGLRGRMYHVARRQRDINVTAIINPARMEIWAEHYPSREDIAELLRYSACVPPGHGESFVRALLAGFEGDMLLVAHLVPPQFEAMLRHIMEGAGADTSILGPTGLQPERVFKPLLELEQAKKVFGEDAVFEMQDVFVDTLGGNLRNEALHGLLTDEQMFSTEVLYAWWLLLRYCVASALLFFGPQEEAGEKVNVDGPKRAESNGAGAT